jgi:hypothetical protein
VALTPEVLRLWFLLITISWVGKSVDVGSRALLTFL